MFPNVNSTDSFNAARLAYLNVYQLKFTVGKTKMQLVACNQKIWYV